MEYRFERLNKDLLKHLVTLYNNVFKIKTTSDFLIKKYDTAYTGISYIGYLAFDTENKPAAYYGVFPMLAEIDGARNICAQSGDTMTQQNHQGKGLFITLAKLTFELAAKEGVKFVFGFPNNNSYPGFLKKLNWTFNEKINKIEIKVPTLPLAKVAKKFTFTNPLYKLYCNLFISNEKINESTFKNFNKNSNSICFTKEYLNYKSYFNHYYLSGDGWQVVFKIDGLLWIGLFECNENVTVEFVINKLKKLCFLLGIDKIMYLGSPNDFTLKQLGSVQKPTEHYNIGFIEFDERVCAEKMCYTSFDVDTF